jgi:hypothetical protein
MYRTLAPQVTENPVFMHLTDATAAGIRSAVDQCAEVGFEMIILSFGSGLKMESTDPVYIENVAKSVAYAHSKGVQIGGYNLMSSSRTVAKGGNSTLSYCTRTLYSHTVLTYCTHILYSHAVLTHYTRTLYSHTVLTYIIR